jgi:formate C-acetyltransferase
MSDRTAEFQAYIHHLNEVGVRYSLFYKLVAESLERTEGEPVALRRAKGFAYLLDHVDQVVHPHELLAGSVLGLWPLAEQSAPYEQRLEAARRVVRRGLSRPPKSSVEGARRALMSRNYGDGSIPYAELQRMARTLTAEQAESRPTLYAEVFRLLQRHFVFDYGETKTRVAALPWFASNHLSLHFDLALRRGLGGLLRQARERGEAATDPERRLFYVSAALVAEAACRFLRRYGATLREASGGPAISPERGRELREMSVICSRLSEAPPTTFREALQLVWMLHLIAALQGASSMSFGRFDQYLHRFYQADRDAGRLSLEEARELLACFWLKVNEPKLRPVQSLCLGGLTPGGEEGANELTYLCLDALRTVAEPYPNCAVRFHRDAPEKLWDEVVGSVLVGAGQPMLYNDDAMLPGLAELGFPEADAREYYPMGCVEVMLHGLQPTYQGSGIVMLAAQLELVFSNGQPNRAGETGPATGELASLVTFEDFLGAYFRQVEHRVHALVEARERRFRQGPGALYDPFTSLLVADCLERGIDVCRGGARYPRACVVNAMSLGTAADALSAVKTFVYDRGLFTLHELKDMLDRDFAGCEDIRALLASGTPAFGNDIEDVDALARRTYQTFVRAVRQHPTAAGATYAPQMFSYHSHVWRGEITGAMPNGRVGGTSFSDGIGPTQGKDTRGLTCMLNSVTSLDHSRLTGGCGFNVKIAPDFVAGPEGKARLKALLKTYLDRGGMQIQVNLVDQDALRDAQERPEEHRNLIVRVGGFCEYFCNLDRKLQDEVIARTAQQR